MNKDKELLDNPSRVNLWNSWFDELARDWTTESYRSEYMVWQRQFHLENSLELGRTDATALLLDTFSIPGEGLSLKERLTLYYLTYDNDEQKQ